MKKILFICYANSCRSQIAEAFAKQYGRDRMEVHSAGVCPAGYIHPLAIQVMEEVGFDIRPHASKPINPATLSQMDRIVLLSPDVETKCPTLPRRVPVERWQIPDPVALFVRGEQQLQAFRVARDAIESHVRELIQAL